MKLLERYLKTVEVNLPKHQRQDVIHELSENILSQIEDTERELGRPLSETEQEGILRRIGNPLNVAARYRHDERSFSFGRQWIGPAFFPLYSKILLANLIVNLSVSISLLFVLPIHDHPSAVAARIVAQLAIQFPIITIIFAVANNRLAKFPDRWDAKHPANISPPPKDPAFIARADSIASLVAGSAFLTGWLAIPNTFSGLFQPGYELIKNVLRLGPAWPTLYAAVLILTVADLALHAINLVRPRWTKARSRARLTMIAGVWVVFYFICQPGVLFVPLTSSSAVYRYVGLAGITFVSLCQFIIELRRLNRTDQR